MKSSIRAKLFLFVYGLILVFIIGLMLLNYFVLENYYIKSRETSLIEAFDEIKEVDIYEYSYISNIQNIENEYNINVQIIKQTSDFDDNFVWNSFFEVPITFNRIYGVKDYLSDIVIARILYDFDQQTFGGPSGNARLVSSISNDEYESYILTIRPEFNYSGDNSDNLIGLCVSKISGDNQDIVYVLTISVQSIEDSIGIFNSFTIIVGIIFILLSFAVMYFISYKFTNPILQINKIAEEISNLNFTNRLDIKSVDELGDLGNSINKMSKQLEQNINTLQKANDRLVKEILEKNDVDISRKEFIASASHELKTPLSMILGYTEALKLPDLNQKTKDEYIHIILDETNKMNNLVKDLLQISQIESGTMNANLKDFKIKNLIDETVNLFSLKFKEQNVKIKVKAIDRLVNSDYNKLQSVLTNFISNALNHLNKEKIIKINVELNANNAVRVSIFNTGNNIPEKDINHIWESFYKVDKARTRNYGGQGLGLSICKAILDLLGYDYGVINHEDGVEFYFEIYLI